VNGKNGAPIERLVSIDTPRPSEDLVGTPARKTSFGSDKENCEKAKTGSVKSPIQETEMKTVEI